MQSVAERAHAPVNRTPVVDLRSSQEARYAQIVAHRHSRFGEQARELERAVFERSLGFSTVEHALRYDPYDHASVFLGVVDLDEDAVVGALRVVRPSPAGLLTVEDMRHGWGMDRSSVERPAFGTTIDLDTTWDVATLSVDPGHRNGKVSCALYQSLCMLGDRAGASSLIAIFDTTAHRLFNVFCNGLMSAYDVEPRMLAGSMSLPVWANIADRQEWLRRFVPRRYDLLVAGKPADGVLPADWDRLSSALAPVPARASR